MNDLKFKVFDPEYDRLADVISIDLRAGTVTYFMEVRADSESGITMEVGDFLKPLTAVKLLMATGLKDRHGLEIFEGDILKKDNGMKGVVEYDHGQFIAKLKPAQTVEYEVWNGHVFDILELAGNRYTDPELV